MLTFMANLATENRFSWFFPVAIALIGVFVAEVFFIVHLIRKVIAAKKAEEQEKSNEEIKFFPMVLALASGSAVSARAGWLIALAILALVGAFALVGLIAFCYIKGILFVQVEKQPVKKLNVFDALSPAKKDKPEPQKGKTDSKKDLHSAMFAFDDAEERLPGEPTVIPAVAYAQEPLEQEEYEKEEDEDLQDDLSALDSDSDDEETEVIDASDDPNLFTGNERIVGYDPATDSNIIERYRKSFESKLIQSEPQIKRYYSGLKNALLSYKGTKSRLSWTADSFHNGRAQLAKINVKTRILEIYFAIDPASLDGTVYRGQDVGELRKYSETPFRYKIRTDRKYRWALELVQRVSEEHGLAPIDIEPVDYESQYPFDTMDNLVKRKLVKVTTRLEKVANEFEYDNTAEPEDEEQPEQSKEFDQTNWELDGGQEADTDLPEEDEPEAIPAVVQTEPAKPTWGDQISLMDQAPDAFFEEQQVGAEFAPKKGRKVDPDLAQVDVALLDLHFNDGDTVTLNVLKRRGLVFSDAQRLKVRASGKMTRQLTIVANQFTYDAISAINEAGGTAQFLR